MLNSAFDFSCNNYANSPIYKLHSKCYPSENEHVKDRIIYVNPLGCLNYFWYICNVYITKSHLRALCIAIFRTEFLLFCMLNDQPKRVLI